MTQKAVCGHSHDGRRRTARAAGLPTVVGGRIGLYEWRSRPPSARAVRHAWLTEQIRAVHSASRGTYGARRVHVELTLGLGLQVGHTQVELLMARQRSRGCRATVVLGPVTRHRRPPIWSSGFSHARRHIGCESTTSPSTVPTRKGVLRGGARHLLLPGSRLVDRLQPDRSAGHQCGSMAIANRDPQGGSIIHSDHGVQFLLGIHRWGHGLRAGAVHGLDRWIAMTMQ
ncbi:IS3 family transposase [Mycobacterium sp. URHB0021]